MALQVGGDGVGVEARPLDRFKREAQNADQWSVSRLM
jgi:hypothetical protein